MPARGKGKLRPLWTCPRCGQRFVSPNMWHSCVRMSVQYHLRGRPKEVVHLYRRYARMVRDLGPGVKAVPVKTGIGFMVRVRFTGVALQKGFVHSFHVRSPEDLDDEVRGWLEEAYRVGIQEHLAAPRRAKA